MNEHEILKTIKGLISDKYIGDDCAYLQDLGLVISQDSLIEDIHFNRNWCTPYQLGYKSVTVNISDILASGAVPAYITIALSLPDNLDDNFITDFYNGAKSALQGSQIIGGDITGSTDKIAISITAIGKTENRNISSRKNAKVGYIIITNGLYGSSAAGLYELKTGGSKQELIMAHLEPKLNLDFAKAISTQVKEPYAMMDTSDGLADALFQIAEASSVKAIVNYESIPHLPHIDNKYVLFGGEDYHLLAAIPEKYIKYIPDAAVIGKCVRYDGVRLDISGNKYNFYSELDVFNHFGENNG